MKRIILAVAATAVAASAGAAGAYFTGQAQVPDNVITAGTVSVSTEPTSAAVCIGALAPGVIERRTMTVVNDGTLPMDFVVTGVKKAGITEFYNVLTCNVATENGTVLYGGPLSRLRTSPVRLEPGARSQLRVALAMPADSGNNLAGDYVKLSFYVDAEQVR